MDASLKVSAVLKGFVKQESHNWQYLTCCSRKNKYKKPYYEVKIFKFVGACLSPNPPPKCGSQTRLADRSCWITLTTDSVVQ